MVKKVYKYKRKNIINRFRGIAFGETFGRNPFSNNLKKTDGSIISQLNKRPDILSQKYEESHALKAQDALTEAYDLFYSGESRQKVSKQLKISSGNFLDLASELQDIACQIELLADQIDDLNEEIVAESRRSNIKRQND